MNLLQTKEIQMTSRDIAELTGKRHDHVLRDIRNEIEALGDIAQPIFGESEYKDGNGQLRPCYTFGRDGAMQLALKYDAQTRFKVIQKLNELEQKSKLPTHVEALRLYADQLEQNEKLQLENKEMKPKADFYDDVAGSKTAIPMGEVSKVLAVKGYGRNKLFQYLREEGILMKNNVPYQAYIDRGYFRVIEQTYNKPDGSVVVNTKTLVYQKGLDFIRKKLK